MAVDSFVVLLEELELMAHLPSGPRRTGRNVEALEEGRLRSEAARPRTQASLGNDQRRLGVDPERQTETMR